MMDRETVLRLAVLAGMDNYSSTCVRSEQTDGVEIDELERFASAVAAAVKEEDARICEGLGWGNNFDVNPRAGTTCAAAIRASIKEVK